MTVHSHLPLGAPGAFPVGSEENKYTICGCLVSSLLFCSGLCAKVSVWFLKEEGNVLKQPTASGGGPEAYHSHVGKAAAGIKQDNVYESPGG